MAMNYAQQLMEMKRKSRLSGQPLSSQQTTALNKQYASGASGRLSGNNTNTSSSLQDQIAAYSNLLTEQRAQTSALTNQFKNALARQAEAYSSLGGSSTVDLTPYVQQLSALQSQIATPTTTVSQEPTAIAEPATLVSPNDIQQRPYQQTLDANDPRLQGATVTPTLQGSGEMPAEPTGNDKAAGAPFSPLGTRPAGLELPADDPSLQGAVFEPSEHLTDEQKAYAKWLQQKWLNQYGTPVGPAVAE